MPGADGDRKAAVRAPQSENLITLLVIFLLLLALSLNRYLAFDMRLTADRPPSPLAVAAVLGAFAFPLLIQPCAASRGRSLHAP